MPSFGPTAEPMKKIILLRHAKSSWKHAGLSDHERPLNKRGRNAAPVIGDWLNRNGHTPDVILCSTAIRTQDTVERLGLSTDLDSALMLQSALYHAAPDDLLTALKALEDTHQSAMIVAHEPGLSSFSGMLAKTAGTHCVAAYEHFPTAAAAIFEADIKRWSELAYCSARFADFVMPRHLERSSD